MSASHTCASVSTMQKLLLVDDEPSIRLTLPLILEEHGFEVTVADTVSTASREIATRKFDVLVSDLNVGQPRDGLSLLKVARRANPKCVCIILTGFPDDDSRAEGLRHGADAYFIKPAEIQELLQSIREKLPQS